MSSSRTERFRELVDQLTSQQPPWMPAPEGVEKPITPKMIEIVQRLQNNLLLVGPTLNWLKAKEAEMARVQLDVLYTPEELAELRST